MVKFYLYNPIDIDLVRQAWEKAFERKFSKKLWQEYWEWNFGSNSLSSIPLVAYIEKQGIVASFIGVIQRSVFTNEGRVIKGGLAVAGFTHPLYQGQGLYKELYSEALPVFNELGIECLFAYDNHNSHYPEVKHLGWKDVGVINEFSWEDGINKIRAWEHEYTIYQGEVSSDHLIRISDYDVSLKEYSFSRDYDYMKWRLLDNPINKYYYANASIGNKLIASIIYKMYKRDTIDVMEIYHLGIDKVEWGSIVAIINNWRELGIKKINIWCGLKTEEHLQFEKIGFTEKGFCTYFVCLPFRLNDYGLLDLSKWHYRFLDSDVY